MEYSPSCSMFWSRIGSCFICHLTVHSAIKRNGGRTNPGARILNVVSDY